MRRITKTCGHDAADADTEQLFRGEENRRFAAIARVAFRKLIQMSRAAPLSDLAVPPGNRLGLLESVAGGTWLSHPHPAD